MDEERHAGDDHLVPGGVQAPSATDSSEETVERFGGAKAAAPGAGTSAPLAAKIEALEAADADRAAKGRGVGDQKRHRLRGALAAPLVGLTCVLLLLSVVVDWTHYTVIDTNGFVNTVGPVIESPAVTASVGREVTDQLVTSLDIRRRVANRLPPVAKPLAVPLTNVVDSFIQGQITKVLRSPKFRALWYGVLRFTHTEVIAALENKSKSITLTDGEVTLNLIPLVNAGLQRVQTTASGLLGHPVKLPTISGTELPATAQAKLSKALGITVPADFGQITLFRASKINTVSGIVRALNLLRWLLPLATLLALFATLWVSARRRRTLLQFSVATALIMIVFRRVILRVQTDLVNSARPANRTAAGDIVRQLTSNLLDIALWVLVAALVLVAGCLVSGPYPWAKALRRGTARGARASASTVHDLWTSLRGAARRSPAADWLIAHRSLLQAAGVVPAAVLMLVLPWLGVLVVLVLLVVYEAGLFWLAKAEASRGAGSQDDTTPPTGGAAGGPPSHLTSVG